MKMLAKMAWLNIWRNKRRTAILLCALVAGLCGILFCKAFINGWLQDMVANAIRREGGHVKIMAHGYRAQPVVEHCMTPDPALPAALDADNRVKSWTERITLQAYLSSPRYATSVTVIGVDPARERSMSIVPAAIREGAFLSEDATGEIVLGRALLDKLGVRLKHKVVLMGQQLSGDMGAGAFRVAGVYTTGDEALDKTTVFVRRGELQKMVLVSNRITEVAILLHDASDANCMAVADSLRAGAAARGADVLTWRELMPFVAEMLDMSGKFMIPFLGVFYIAMAFGVLNTLLIAVSERRFEVGVMRAVGMPRGRIVALVVLEACCIGAVAVALGTGAGVALVHVLYRTGIDLGAFAEGMSFLGLSRVIRPELYPGDAVVASVVAFGMTVASALLPALRIVRVPPVTAMRKMR